MQKKDETTLHNIPTNAIIYEVDSIVTKKTPILAQKPINGGKPAIESTTVANNMAKVVFDLTKEETDKIKILEQKLSIIRSRVEMLG